MNSSFMLCLLSSIIKTEQSKTFPSSPLPADQARQGGSMRDLGGFSFVQKAVDLLFLCFSKIHFISLNTDHRFPEVLM